jgi:YfiH family protein
VRTFCRVLERRTAANGVVYFASPLLAAVGVPHAFSTRHGGTSPPPFDSLNLGNPSGCDVQDDSARIQANYARLHDAIGCAGRARCSVHQVHGRDVADVYRDRPFESGQKADALVGDDPARVLAVRVADCVPILVATDDGRTVAVIHAGWRGVVADIVTATVDALRRRRPDVGPGRLVAAIGPCIGADAFEVGPEVLAAFARAFGADAPAQRRAGDDGKGYANLREGVRRQLVAAGVPREQIDVTDRCTVRDAADFYSHRRDHGITGRLAALIAPRG